MSHYGDNEGLTSFALAVVLGLCVWVTILQTMSASPPEQAIVDRSRTTFPDTLERYNE